MLFYFRFTPICNITNGNKIYWSLYSLNRLDPALQTINNNILNKSTLIKYLFNTKQYFDD